MSFLGRRTRGAFSRARIATSPGLAIVSGLSLLAAFAVGTSQFAKARADSTWKPSSILEVLKKGTGQVVIAHRGVYGKGCPENSTCSIKNTYTSGIEGIELDVKQSKNGTPWLFHDQNAGRVIAHDPPFNSFQGAKSPRGWNPDFRTLTDAQIKSAYLRDASGAKTIYRPVSLQGAFATITSQDWDHMVILLDLKTLDAVSRAADLAKQYGVQNAVVLKFSASLLANNAGAFFDLQQETKGVPFAPTMYAPDMANIMKAGWKYSACGGQSALEESRCTVESWLLDLQDDPGYAWVEVGNKLPATTDPTNFLLESKDLGAKGGFQPVPEFPDRTGPGHSYVRSNGTCCAALSDYLTPANKWFPAENKDGRENIHNLLDHGISSVITDSPQAAIKAMTKRDTSQYS